MLFYDVSGKYFEFMVLGFSVILGTMALFILRLLLRFRNHKREMALLDELEAEMRD